MNSGIKVPQDIQQVLSKLGSATKKKETEYVILSINIQNKRTGNIVLEEEMPTDGSQKVLADDGVDLSTLDVNPAWYQFRRKMTEKKAAYGACYFNYKTDEGADRSKLVGVSYVREDANINERMFYSSTKDEVKKKMDANVFVECDSKDDFSYKDIKSRVHTR